MPLINYFRNCLWSQQNQVISTYWPCENVTKIMECPNLAPSPLEWSALGLWDDQHWQWHRGLLTSNDQKQGPMHMVSQGLAVLESTWKLSQHGSYPMEHGSWVNMLSQHGSYPMIKCSVRSSQKNVVNYQGTVFCLHREMLSSEMFMTSYQ